MLQDKNHFTIFAEKSLCFSRAQQFTGGTIVFFGLPASARFETRLGVVRELRAPASKRGATSSPASIAFQSYQNLASPDFSGSLTRDACSASPTWQASLSSWWKGIRSCGEMPVLGVGLEDHKPVACFSRNCVLVPPPSCPGILSSHPSL